jgi:hypothetical protein
MKTRRGGMWGVKSDKEMVDRKVKEIVQLYHLGDTPLRSPNTHKTEDRQFEVELMDILSGIKRKELNEILRKLLTYHGSERIIPMIRRLYITLTGGRKTKRGGWPWSTPSPSKEDVFADQILADSSKATDIIRSPYTNLERLRKKIVEKDTEKRMTYILNHIDYEMKARRYHADQNSWI